jgi:hypothetical protein
VAGGKVNTYTMESQRAAHIIEILSESAILDLAHFTKYIKYKYKLT